MSNPKTLHKPTSRITLEDLFGPGPLPGPAEIEALAERTKADLSKKKAKAALRRKARGLTPTDNVERLEAIRTAAAALGTTLSLQKTWHPTARLLVIAEQVCTSCHTTYRSPGASEYLIEYTNSRTGATQASPIVGPVHPALPVKEFTHKTSVSICGACSTGGIAEGEAGAEAPNSEGEALNTTIALNTSNEGTTE